jgi:monovalent cation:H+ antiporter, CPA1 family
MSLSLISVLTIFTLLAFSSVAFFASKKTGIPHSVLLVAIGVVLVVLGQFETFAFLKSFSLTPELLFYIFLPTLIFESAYNIRIRAITKDAIPVMLLAIPSLLISAVVIAAGLYYLLPLVGFPIPFTVAFLFGALISATDPVAVLALFKEYGAPRRLSLLFEGESLFNDGTGFALFLLALEFTMKGGFSAETALHGVVSFVIMIVGGSLFGLSMGGIFSKFIGYARGSESVSITLTLVLAHVTFLLSEFISAHAHIGDVPIHLSAIIATTVAAMFFGNYGRTKLPHGAEEFVEKFWGQIAFFANSLIFILIGLLAVSLPISSPELLMPVAIVVVLVALARAFSIYPVLGLWNKCSNASGYIPRAWQHLLAWGSLRGALAVTMALLVPADLVFAGWENNVPIQDAIIAFTTGCIFVTLFLKATTIGPLMRILGIGDLSGIERAQHNESRSLVYSRVLERLDRFLEKKYITKETYEHLRTYYLRRKSETHDSLNAGSDVSDAVLRIWVLGVEREAAKDLFVYGEISEQAYKRILAKLSARLDDAENGVSSSELHIPNYIDIFERLAERFRRVLGEGSIYQDPKESFMYYRALTIISHKVEKELVRIQTEQSDGIFSETVLNNTSLIYRRFAKDSREKMEKVVKNFPEVTRALAEHLARRGVLKVEENVLRELNEHHMITPNVFVSLKKELEEEIQRLD